MDRVSCGGICGRPIISAIVVTCNGPCRKRFHPECAGFWNLSVDQLSYLLWFCGPCQRDLPMSRIALQRLVQQLCRNPDDAVVVELPEEVLEMIFRHLNYFQLAQVRRTCHRWKAIVDGSTVLRRKLCIQFPRDIMLDRDYEPSCLPPAVKAVKICQARIVAVDPWWPSLGEKLVEISLNNCIISVTRLASMLRQAPNLKSIDFECLDGGTLLYGVVDGSKGANFQMNQMEKVVLHKCGPSIRNLLASVCNRLVTFHGPNEDVYDDNELLLYIEKWQKTLKSILVIPSENMLTALCHINLQLTDLSLVCHFIQSNHVIPLLQRLQNLKRLKLVGIKLQDTLLHEIAKILPELAILVVEINREGDGWDMSFLNVMPKLEQFRAILEHQPNYTTELLGVSFYGCRSRKLQEIELCGIELEWDDLYEFLKEAPNLHTVTLAAFPINGWYEIFEALPMTKLRSLTLSAITCTPNSISDSLADYYDNLRCLKLDKVDMCVQTLRVLFRLSPGLEVVSLHSLNSLDDSTVLELTQKVKRLADLTISACPISDASIGHIIQNCTALERLDIQNCQGITCAVQGMIVGSWLNEVMGRIMSFSFH